MHSLAVVTIYRVFYKFLGLNQSFLNNQLNKCFADYLESGSVLTNKPILTDAHHRMDKIIAWTRVVQIESLN
ncbi:hypothetical protein Nit79A3_1239 [Nitrosomonas sp. Is79A3]